MIFYPISSLLPASLGDNFIRKVDRIRHQDNAEDQHDDVNGDIDCDTLLQKCFLKITLYTFKESNVSYLASMIALTMSDPSSVSPSRGFSEELIVSQNFRHGPTFAPKSEMEMGFL